MLKIILKYTVILIVSLFTLSCAGEGDNEDSTKKKAAAEKAAADKAAAEKAAAEKAAADALIEKMVAGEIKADKLAEIKQYFAKFKQKKLLPASNPIAKLKGKNDSLITYFYIAFTLGITRNFDTFHFVYGPSLLGWSSANQKQMQINRAAYQLYFESLVSAKKIFFYNLTENQSGLSPEHKQKLESLGFKPKLEQNGILYRLISLSTKDEISYNDFKEYKSIYERINTAEFQNDLSVVIQRLSETANNPNANAYGDNDFPHFIGPLLDFLRFLKSENLPLPLELETVEENEPTS